MEWKQLLQSDRDKPSLNKDPKDLRTEFEKDYHRIIGSVEFRRLQDKTQVFPLDKSDFIRTRLTHSLEVASFAKSLGRNVGTVIMERGLDPDFDENMKEAVGHILECAGLIHDIGNPPFGHFGEVAIRSWFTDHLSSIKYKDRPLRDYMDESMIEDFLSYDGNAQGLRLLTKLHMVSSDHGMNLTYALLATSIKYPVSSDKKDPDSDNISYTKPGYFAADKDMFDKIEKSCGLDGVRHPLVYLLEAADDIAYKTADIEDGFKKGYIRYDDLMRELSDLENEFRDQYDEIFAGSDILRGFYEAAIEKGLDNPEENAVQNWAMATQSYLLEEASSGFIDNYDKIMEGTYRYDVFHDSFAAQLMKLLRNIGWNYIFDTPSIYKLEVRSWHVYEFLLKKFVRAVLYYDTELSDEKLSPIDKKIFTMIDSQYVRAYERESKECPEGTKLYLRLLMAVDFISGMTDSKALRLYQELNGVLDI